MSKFSSQLDKIVAINLASVRGPFTSFKYSIENNSQRRTTPIFHIERPFSRQTMDLFLGLFSGFGRNLIWEVDNLVEFINICTYCMVKERLIDHLFHFAFPPNCCDSFLENQFCKVLFNLKLSGYLFSARCLCDFESRNFENIFVFEDLASALLQLFFSVW